MIWDRVFSNHAKIVSLGAILHAFALAIYLSQLTILGTQDDSLRRNLAYLGQRPHFFFL